MELFQFISSLLTEGKVSVKTKFHLLDSNDIERSGHLLYKYYEEDKMEMAFDPPVYSEKAAIWAAEYLYKTVQFTILRDAGEDIMNGHLKSYEGEMNPSAVYSADLMLRYLPKLFELAKGLAPADILVRRLRDTAFTWPLSSVGIELGQPVNDETILSNASLTYLYIDRIIKEKDKNRLKNEGIVGGIREITGIHLKTFWPEFENS
jgi:hypothetical protein